MDIKTLYQNGKSLREIARIKNTNHHKIKRILVKCGIQLRSKKEQATLNIDVKEALKLLKGDTAKGVSKSLGISRNTLYRRLSKIGVKLSRSEALKKHWKLNKYPIGRIRPETERAKISYTLKRVSKKGKQSHAYKNGYTPLDKIVFLRSDWHSKIKKRDNYTCQLCGYTGYVEAHHSPKPYKQIRDEVLRGIIGDKYKLADIILNDERFKNAEGITLCKKCHVMAHKKNKVNSGEIQNG